jgi:hypothetical protein
MNDALRTFVGIYPYLCNSCSPKYFGFLETGYKVEGIGFFDREKHG